MSDVSPYAPPKSKLIEVSDLELSSKGRYAIYRPGAEWPGRCFKCNAGTSFKKNVKLTYVNPWIYLSILLSPLITVVLALIFQKKYHIDLPICEHHARKRKRFLTFQWGMTALMLVGFVVGIAAEERLFLLGAISLLLIITLSAIFGRMVYAAKFKDKNLWVAGTGKEFRSSLPEFIS